MARIAARTRRSGTAAPHRTMDVRHPARWSPWLAWILACLPLLTFAASGASTAAFVRPTDLRAEAHTLAERGIPMVVLFSQTACSWCDRARQQLLWRAHEEHGDAIALFRQIDIDSTVALIDFNGATMSHGEFARTQGVRFTPTLVLYGPQGERLAEPILGIRLPDFYAQYVEQAIAEAQSRLAAPE